LVVSWRLKSCPQKKSPTPNESSALCQEAKAASSLNHANIITIYDIGEAEGVDFISMEPVSGKSLDRLMPRQRMGLNDALIYAVQTADAP
jgi:serine/threonine-protein kinase